MNHILGKLCVYLQHKDYDKANTSAAFPNDIALLKLDSKAPSNYVIPVASNGDFANEKCEISGWGYTCKYK